MLESCKDARERWGGVHQIIDRWLQERQEMIVLYCGINTLKSYSSRETPLSVKIQSFCELLVDYCSAGHFEVYQQLHKEAEEFKDVKGLELLEKYWPNLQANTEKCLSFNDKYQTKEDCIANLTDLPKDLSEIGEELEKRFEMEDELIKVIHDMHSDQVA